MKEIIKYLKEKGYEVDSSYYEQINDWVNIWKGNAPWIKIPTVNGGSHKMYSLNMAKRSCEDYASILTSETYEINTNDKNVLKNVEKSKLLEKLPKQIEKMAYSGTTATIVKIKNAELIDNQGQLTLKKGVKTKKKLVSLCANQIIPLRLEDDEIVDVAFVSEESKKINGKKTKVYYIETHILKENGYQITNVYLDEKGKEIEVENNIIKTYNTLTNVPLFAILKNNKENVIENNLGLGASLFANSIDQLQIIDLTYNNFGSDFRLGQKIMLINKKLTQEVLESYKDEEGNIKQRKRIVYPTEIQKQLFQETDTGIMSNDEKLYIHEYNPDLRVGDNKEGVQFALDIYSFSIGFGTKYYQIDAQGVKTATEYNGNRQDLIANGTKDRKVIKNYIINVINAMKVADKILGLPFNENEEIKIPDIDGFLEDDNVRIERARLEVASGVMSKMTYLTKIKGYTEEEALKEIELINNENSITFSSIGE